MLAIFAVAAALMYARLVPALLAVPLMALGIAAVAGAGFAGLESVAVDGTSRLAGVMVTVIFGAILSRVTLASGIAETIVTYAAEFGGDRPAVLALALSAAVALLFTSLTGLGAIVMVGSIVLPIMLTVGVARRTAATLFMLAFALGFVFNIAQWTFYTKTFGVERAQMQPYAYVLGAIDLAALVVFALVRFRATRGSATWALEPDEPLARKRAPLYACVAPILPIPLYQAAHLDAIVAFALAAAYAALTTAPRKAVPTFVAAAIRGVEDVAPAIVLFMGIGMLLVATGLPSVKAALGPLVAAVAPRSWLGYVVLFGLFSPARALSRTAQPLRRRHRGVYRARGPRHPPRGHARRRGDGGRAGAERVRSHEHAERLGRELHGHPRGRNHEADAPVSSRGRNVRDARRRRVRRQPLRHGSRFARPARRASRPPRPRRRCPRALHGRASTRRRRRRERTIAVASSNERRRACGERRNRARDRPRLAGFSQPPVRRRRRPRAIARASRSRRSRT